MGPSSGKEYIGFSDINCRIFSPTIQDLSILPRVGYNLTMNEYRFNTGKVVLNYVMAPDTGQKAGTRPAVVLLHGGSGHWQHMEGLLTGLAERWQVYAPDLRGHGLSGRVPWGYAINDYAIDIAAFLEQVSGPAFLFGHSLGGIIAQMTAATYPENVAGLLLGDSPLDSGPWNTFLQTGREKLEAWIALSGGRYTVEEILGWLKDVSTGPPGEDGRTLLIRAVFPENYSACRELAERLYQQDPNVLGMLLEDYAHAAAGFDMQSNLPAIRCPVLLMQADPAAGSVMTDAEVQRALLLLRYPSHVRFDGLSHQFLFEDPQRVLQAMEDFMGL